MKNRVPVLITVVVGTFMILKFFFIQEHIKSVADEIEQWGLVIIGFAILLGVANILRINWKAVMARRQDWQYKLVLVVSMIGMMVIGAFEMIKYGDVFGPTIFNYLFINFLVPLGATMFALLAFFIASAAFRAFRIKNLSAALLMTAAVIVMIGRVPLGAAISEIFPQLAGWMMHFPNAAGQRGIIMGAAMGVIATGLRIIFGIERPYLKGE